jgi:pyrroline-5-carboxylate reductase
MVTSPGGTTAAGLKVFEEEDLFGIVREALQAAVKRAGELGRKE